MTAAKSKRLKWNNRLKRVYETNNRRKVERRSRGRRRRRSGRKQNSNWLWVENKVTNNNRNLNSNNNKPWTSTENPIEPWMNCQALSTNTHTPAPANDVGNNIVIETNLYTWASYIFLFLLLYFPSVVYKHSIGLIFLILYLIFQFFQSFLLLFHACFEHPNENRQNSRAE